MYVCNRYLGYVLWPNYEVAEFQPQSGITTSLDSAAYCYVPLPCLPCYYSPRLSHRTRSSGHLGVASLHTGIPTSRSDFPLLPWLLMCGSLNPLPPLCFPIYSRQSFPKMIIYCLVVPPCIPPESSPLAALLSCSKFKNRPQHHTLCYCSLLYPYVGHHWLSSHRFPQYLCPGRLPCPIWFSSLSLPCDIHQKTRVCALYLPLHCLQKYPSLRAKN